MYSERIWSTPVFPCSSGVSVLVMYTDGKKEDSGRLYMLDNFHPPETPANTEDRGKT